MEVIAEFKVTKVVVESTKEEAQLLLECLNNAESSLSDRIKEVHKSDLDFEIKLAEISGARRKITKIREMAEKFSEMDMEEVE